MIFQVGFRAPESHRVLVGASLFFGVGYAHKFPQIFTSILALDFFGQLVYIMGTKKSIFHRFRGQPRCVSAYCIRTCPWQN